MKKKTVTGALVALATLATLTTGAQAADDLPGALAQQKLEMQDARAVQSGQPVQPASRCELNGALATSPAGTALHCIDHQWQEWTGEWADVTFTALAASADPAHARPELVDTFTSMVGIPSMHAFTYTSASLAGADTPGTLVPHVQEKTLSLVIRVVDFSADHTLANLKMTLIRSDTSARTEVESTIPVGTATKVLSLDGTEYTVLVKNLKLS